MSRADVNGKRLHVRRACAAFFRAGQAWCAAFRIRCRGAPSVRCRSNTPERACPARTSKRRAIGRRAACGKGRPTSGARGRGRGRGFLIHLRISFAATCAARTRDAHASGGESSALHTRAALRDAAHERKQSRIAVACAVAGKRARRPPRCATDGRDTDAPASFRPRVTDTKHFEPVSPDDADAAPRQRNHACATGIGRAMTLRSLPRQNSQIEAIQCASKDA